MVDSTLADMLQEIEQAPEVYRPSHIWSRLVHEHVADLDAHGLERFKRTINAHYGEEQIASTQAAAFALLGKLLGRTEPRGGGHASASRRITRRS